MMDLPFDPRIFAAIEEIPIAAGVAVVGPARDGRIIAQDHLARRLGLRREAEIAHPGIDFGWSGRIPWHFGPEGIFRRPPMDGAVLPQRLHLGPPGPPPLPPTN